MRILVTGSSGWLGQTLVPRLRADGHEVVGLDPRPSPLTTIVGSVADRATVDTAMRGVEGVVHAGALHKPDIERFTNADFVAVNVTGTLNLLEAAADAGVTRFVFTSTTSLMITREIRAGVAGGAREAFWIDEEMAPLLPRNIYGVTKLSAEHLCRFVAQERGLPVIVLRTSRFFPEDDDMAHEIRQSEPNTKANEYLFRRIRVEDVAESVVVALARAPEIGFDTFIVSAPTPFRREDARALVEDAPKVVAGLFPEFPELYSRAGWTMFQVIDRVYDAGKAERVLGFRAKTDFAAVLEGLSAGLNPGAP